jgi:excisionase family DNA binding protein
MNTTINRSADLLRISQAATLLDVDSTTVLRWIQKGYIKSTRYPSGSHRIKRSEVQRFIREARHHAKPEKKEYRIMIIDDEEFLGGVLQEVLETSGLPLTIKTNRDPLSALIEIGMFNPDLIIVDYKLGDIDGVMLTEKVRRNPQFDKIPIVMISGYIETLDLREFPGVTAFLSKPFKSADLRKTVIKCLDLDRPLIGEPA